MAQTSRLVFVRVPCRTTCWILLGIATSTLLQASSKYCSKFSKFVSWTWASYIVCRHQENGIKNEHLSPFYSSPESRV